MKKLFLYLLKKYTKTEKDRIDIIEVLNENVICEYNEQTGFGNIYNSHIEFIMGNKLIRSIIYENRAGEVDMIKGNLTSSIDAAIRFIKNEPRRQKLKKIKNVNKGKN